MKYIQPEMDILTLEGIYTELIVDSVGSDTELSTRQLTVSGEDDNPLQ